MSNILMIPASAAIIFDSQSPNSSVVSPLSTAPRISYDNAGGLNITSYTTATSSLDRFTVDGSTGRLLSVTDALTGTIFSVNDAAGLPIIQVDSALIDIVTTPPSFRSPNKILRLNGDLIWLSINLANGLAPIFLS